MKGAELTKRGEVNSMSKQTQILKEIEELCYNAIDMDIEDEVTDGTNLIITGRAELAESILKIISLKTRARRNK